MQIQFKMLKKFFLTSFLLFISFLTIYPSKKEKTSLVDYCYSFEKILSRNTFEKSKNVFKTFNIFAKGITSISTTKTKGALVNKLIDQYKSYQEFFILNLVPNKFYCLAGYWIEAVKPGTIQSILYKKSQQRINQYEDIKKGVGELIEEFDSEYKSIKKEINNLF